MIYGVLIRKEKHIMRVLNNTVTLLLIIIALNLSGCKVKYSFSGASISPEVKTCSVQYIQNRAPLAQSSLSQQLTDALKDKIQNQTRLVLVNGNSDVNFEGEISGYNTSPTNIRAQDKGAAAQNRLTISVRIKYTNSKDQQLDFDKTFSRYEDFDARTSLTDAINNGILDDIITQIVQDIFNEAFVNW